jgi:hypothetical protein
MTDSSRLSTSNCRISRRRPAPTDSRTAISRSRAVARARSKLATLLHAINRTDAARIISIDSVAWNGCSISSLPRPPGRRCNARRGVSRIRRSAAVRMKSRS